MIVGAMVSALDADVQLSFILAALAMWKNNYHRNVTYINKNIMRVRGMDVSLLRITSKPPVLLIYLSR